MYIKETIYYIHKHIINVWSTSGIYFTILEILHTKVEVPGLESKSIFQYFDLTIAKKHNVEWDQ